MDASIGVLVIMVKLCEELGAAHADDERRLLMGATGQAQRLAREMG